jgi:hypothetical protein
MDGLDVKLELVHDHVREQNNCVLTFKCVFMHPEARSVMYDTNFVAQVTPRIKHTIDSMFEQCMSSSTPTSTPTSTPMPTPTPDGERHVRNRLGSARRVIHLEHYAGKTCSVCQSNYVTNEFVRTLPICKHVFHKRCIDPWIKRNHNPTCPMCREIIYINSTRSESPEPEHPALE